MPKGSETTTKFKVDISELKAGMQEAKRSIALANSEFKASTAGMDSWGKSADGLSAKVKQLDSTLSSQKTILSSLEKQHALVAKEQGENSKGAQDLMIKINNQKASIGKTESELKNYKTKLDDVKSASSKMAEETNDSRTSLDKLKDTISKQDSQLAKLKTAYANVVLEQGKNSKEAKDLAKEIKTLSGDLDDNKNKLSGAEGEAEKLSGSLDEAGNSAKETSGGFSVLKGALAELVADGIRETIRGLKEMGKFALEVGGNFDSGMSKVGAVSGASAEQMAELRDKAKEMGASTKFSATESAEAFNYMAMAGWKTNDMLDGIEGIMNLAAASGEDLANTSDIVTDALTAFGMTAADSGKFADILATASSNANTNVGMMGETFKYIAPLAGAMGYSAEDTAVAIGLMANSGIKASSAGTQLRAALTNMVKPTESMEAIMQELGLSVSNDDGSMKSLDQTLNEIRSAFKITTAEQKQQNLAMIEQEMVSKGNGEALKGLTEEEKYFKAAMFEGQKQVEALSEKQFKKQAMNKLGVKVTKESNREQIAQNLALSLGTQAIEGLTQEQQSAYAATLFGKEAMSGMLAIINSSQSDYDKLSDSINNSSGAAKNMANVMQDNLQGDMTIFQSTLEGVGIAAYEKFQAPLRDAIQSVTDYLSSSDAKQLIDDIGVAVGNIATKIAEVIPPAIEKVKELFNFIADNKDTIISAIAGIVAGFAAFKIGSLMSSAVKAISGFVTVIKGANFSFKALNATMKANIIILIVSIIASLVAAFITLWNTSEEFRNFWINLWETVKSAFMTAFNAIVNFFTVTIPTTFNNFITFLGGIVNSIVNFFTVTIPTAFTNAVTAVGNFITSVINFFTSLPGKIATFLGNVITNVATWASNMVTKAAEMGTNFVNNVMQFFSSLPYKIGFALGTVIKKVLEFGKKLINFAKTEIPKFVSNVVQFISQLPGKFWTWLTNTISKVISWGSNLVSTGRQKASEFINAVINFIRELPGKVWEWLTSTISKVVTWGSNMVNTGKENASSFLKTVINTVKALPGRIWNAIIGAIDKVIQWGSDLAAKGVQAATDLLNAVINTAKGMPGEIMAIGSNIVSGVWQGIVNAKDKFFADVKNFFSNLIQGAKDALGIKSPSRVFRDQVGKMIVKGLQVGIARNASSAINTLDNLCKKMLNSALRANGNYKTAGSNAVKNFEDGFKQMMSTSTTNIENAVNAYVKKQNAREDKRQQERIDKKKASMESANKELKKQINKNNKEQINEQINANKKALDKEIKQIKADTKKKKEEYAKAGKSVINAYSSAMQKAADKVKNALSNKLNKIAEETQAKYDEIAKMEEDFRTKLNDYGELFSRDEDGNMILNDINKDISTLKTYGTNLTKLKGKISEELMQEIAGMNVEDAVEFTAGLLQMSEKELQEYNNAYTQKLATAKQISKAFYAEKMAEIKAEYTDKVNKAFANVSKDLQNAGKNAIDGFMKGMTKQAKKADKQVKKIANNIVKQFKKSLKIHSPSRVFEELGVFSGVGYLNGFKGSMANFKNTIADSVRKQALSSKVASGKSGVQQVTYNFYQTNNSPKSLNRLDIYRQTRNQLNFARGV